MSFLRQTPTQGEFDTCSTFDNFYVFKISFRGASHPQLFMVDYILISLIFLMEIRKVEVRSILQFSTGLSLDCHVFMKIRFDFQVQFDYAFDVGSDCGIYTTQTCSYIELHCVIRRKLYHITCCII